MATQSNSVLSILKADHKKVKELFAEYEEAAPRKQQDIAQTTIQELGDPCWVRRRAHLSRDSKGNQGRQADE
jgi:hypothetical protein